MYVAILIAPPLLWEVESLYTLKLDQYTTHQIETVWNEFIVMLIRHQLSF